MNPFVKWREFPGNSTNLDLLKGKQKLALGFPLHRQRNQSLKCFARDAAGLGRISVPQRGAGEKLLGKLACPWQARTGNGSGGLPCHIRVPAGVNQGVPAEGQPGVWLSNSPVDLHSRG